ncbi:MAG: hypothetical protein FIA92_11340 [Chloroflexi bacterium]|nr:hypothetical protein [Chloroflexota bacterium]
MKLAIAIGAVIGLAALAWRFVRPEEIGPYPLIPRHLDPEYVLIEDGFLVEEPGLYEPSGGTTLRVSAAQQTRKGL